MMSNIIDQIALEKQDEYVCILCEGRHGHNLMCEMSGSDNHEVL